MSTHLLKLLSKARFGGFAGRKAIQNWLLAASTPGDVYDVPQAERPDYYGVAYGNGMFVAVGEYTEAGTAAVMTSPDGISWQNRSLPAGSPTKLRCVVYAAGLWVAGGGAGDQSGTNGIITSTDGITWTVQTCTASHEWTGITYGAGLFVAVSGNLDSTNNIQTSPDGVTWTARTHPSAVAVRSNSVAFGNGLFVAVGNALYFGGQSITSTDGMSWSSQYRVRAQYGVYLAGIAYVGDRFIAVGETTFWVHDAFSTTDGISWTEVAFGYAKSTQNLGIEWTGIAAGAGSLVAVGSTSFEPKVMSSANGLQWFLQDLGGSNTGRPDNLRSVAYGNGRFVAVGKRTWSSIKRSPSAVYK